ncbi:MAG: signal recognition particle-docking protein FtsY [Candidatus Woesearchaeota archaeon]
MFGFLKKKLKDAVTSFTKKVDEEGEKEEIVEEKKEEPVIEEEKEESVEQPKEDTEEITEDTSKDDTKKKPVSKKTKLPKKTKTPSKKKPDEPKTDEADVSEEEKEIKDLDSEKVLDEKKEVSAEEPKQDVKKTEEKPPVAVTTDDAKSSDTSTKTEELAETDKQDIKDDSTEKSDPTLVTDERVSVESDEVVLDTSIDEEKPAPKRGFFGRMKDRWSGKSEPEETEPALDKELQESDKPEQTDSEDKDAPDETKTEEKKAALEEKKTETAQEDTKKTEELTDLAKDKDEPVEKETKKDDDDSLDADVAKEDTEKDTIVKDDIKKLDAQKADVEKEDTEEEPDSAIEKTLSEEKEKLEKEYEEKQPVKEDTEEEPEEPKGFFGRLRQSISSRKISEGQFEDMFWEIEMALLENSVAVEVIEKIKNDLHESIVGKPIPRSEVEGIVLKRMSESLQDLFNQPPIKLIEAIEKKKKDNKPYVICFVGVNGSGKTTTIAKVVHMLKQKGYESVISASDTFRAAAIDQLQIHADKLGVKLIKHDYNSDPAAVAFDAIKHAEAKKKHVVLIDTAGRLHSNANLMEELHKIIKIAKPDLTVFLGEAITGNDCIEQAREFNEMVPIDGIILSKADIDQKGGAAISISYVLGKPIMFLGVGQNYEDLREFTPEFVLKELEI